MLAVEDGKKQIVSTLIQAAEKEAHKLLTTVRFGQNALTLAVLKNHKEIVSILVNAIIQASGMKNIISELTETIDLEYKITASFMLSIKNGHTDIVRLFIKVAGDMADEFVTVINQNDFTTLMFAAQNGNPLIVSDLIRVAGQHSLKLLAAKNKLQQTALMFAAQYGHAEVVKIIIKTLIQTVKGENEASQFMLTTDKDKFTALMYAAQNGHASVVSILIDADNKSKASEEIIEVRKKHLQSALTLACKSEHTNAAFTLIDAIYSQQEDICTLETHPIIRPFITRYMNHRGSLLYQALSNILGMLGPLSIAASYALEGEKTESKVFTPLHTKTTRPSLPDRNISNEELSCEALSKLEL